MVTQAHHRLVSDLERAGYSTRGFRRAFEKFFEPYVERQYKLVLEEGEEVAPGEAPPTKKEIRAEMVGAIRMVPDAYKFGEGTIDVVEVEVSNNAHGHTLTKWAYLWDELVNYDIDLRIWLLRPMTDLTQVDMAEVYFMRIKQDIADREEA